MPKTDNLSFTDKQMKARIKVLNDIPRERSRQDRIHGNQIQDYLMMFAILSEEFGEVAEALQVHYGLQSVKRTDKANLYKELIQVSAYAAKFAENVLLNNCKNS